MAHGGADAIGAGVAAADDDDVAILGGDEAAVAVLIEDRLRVRGEEVHGEMDAFERTALDGKVAGLGGAGAEDDGVEVVHQFLRRNVLADLGVANKNDAFVLHLLDAAKHDFLLVEFHVRDAVHEEPTGAVGALEDGDVMAGAVELGGGAKTGWTRADDGDALVGAAGGSDGGDPAFVPAVIGDGDLNVLDGHGGGVHAEDAGAVARGGTDAAGELGEVVGLVETLEGFFPEAAVDEVVPLGDQVIDGAAAGHAADERAGMAEGDAAVHTAGALGAEFVLFHVEVERVVVADALERLAVGGKFPREFDEAGWFAHGVSLGWI